MQRKTIFAAAAMLALSAASAHAAQVSVFAEDFEGAVNPALGGAGAVASTQGFSAVAGFDAMFLHNVATGSGNATTLTLTGLPAHDAISIEFLLGIIASWDGPDLSFPRGDYFNVSLDGDLVFRHSYCHVRSQCTTTAPGTPTVTGQNLNDPTGDGLSEFGFVYAEWPESAWDMAAVPGLQNIAHSASSATILFFADGPGYQGGADESWAIDGINVSVRTSDVPLPAAAPLLLVGLGALAGLRRRR